jgi:hypothetical protein
MGSSMFARVALVTFSLVVISTVGVAAQPSDEIPAMQVSGVVVFADTDPVEPPTSITVGGAATKVLGASAVRQLTMDDERLSGSQRAVWNKIEYGMDGSSVAGRLLIENDDGSWQGTYQGVIFPHAPDAERYQAVLVGEGEYEGLSAVLYYDPTDTDDTLAVDGLIFMGEFPDYPALD